MKAATIRIGRRTIAVSNPHKILFGSSGYTKKDMIAYYYRIASHMLPLVKDRPLSLLRFPNGVHGEKFFQKRAFDYFPTWIERVKIKYLHPEHHDNKRFEYYTVCNNAATLVYLANYVCVPHIWLSRKDKLHYPDRLIFDLDPADKMSFSYVRESALWLKQFLVSLGLYPFVMTTGSRGMHIVVPLKRMYDFDYVRECARMIAKIMVQQDPDHLTIETRKTSRGTRMLVDYLRNGYGSTGVAPYAVRDREGAPIATPIDWREVNDKKLTSQRYTIKNIFKTVTARTDPWHDIARHAASIGNVQKKLARYR